MFEQKPIVILSVDEYKRLVKQDERVEVIKRLFAKSKFVGMDDIKIVLAIREEDIRDPEKMGVEVG
jgi:hypothetical protein